jgi:hypothetical protein
LVPLIVNAPRAQAICVKVTLFEGGTSSTIQVPPTTICSGDNTPPAEMCNKDGVAPWIRVDYCLPK